MKESTLNKYKLVIDEWFVNGFNGTQAYLKCYPNSSYDAANQSFQDILQIPTIQEYKESKQEKTSNTLQITLERQLLELERMKGLSEVKEKFNDAINALKEQSKLLGFYEQHNNQRVPSGLITEAEAKEIKKALEDEY